MLKIWNGLGLALDLSSPRVGPAGSVTGSITYNAGRFGNGSYSSSANNCITFSGLAGSDFSNFQKYTLEFWLNTDWSITNGTTSDGQLHIAGSLFQDASNYHEMQFWGDGTGLDLYDGSAGIVFTTGVTWSASTNTHFALVVNSAGIAGGSDKTRVYINGVKVGNSSSCNKALTGTVSLVLLRYRNAALYTWKGLIDNVKLYNHEKTDFSDRNNERAGMNDQKIII